MFPGFFFTEESKLVPLQRSESVESTQSEREFRKKYQAITHRMVHRKSSAVMYSRILERTFGKTKIFIFVRFVFIQFVHTCYFEILDNKIDLVQLPLVQACNCGLNFSNVVKGSLTGLKSNSIK